MKIIRNFGIVCAIASISMIILVQVSGKPLPPASVLHAPLFTESWMQQ